MADYKTKDDLVAAFWAEYERACLAWVELIMADLMENENSDVRLFDS